MTQKRLPKRPDTGLAHGMLTAIAKRYSCTLQHVHEVARGDRGGTPQLLRAIRRAQDPTPIAPLELKP